MGENERVFTSEIIVLRCFETLSPPRSDAKRKLRGREPVGTCEIPHNCFATVSIDKADSVRSLVTASGGAEGFALARDVTIFEW